MLKSGKQNQKRLVDISKEIEFAPAASPTPVSTVRLLDDLISASDRGTLEDSWIEGGIILLGLGKIEDALALFNRHIDCDEEEFDAGDEEDEEVLGKPIKVPKTNAKTKKLFSKKMKPAKRRASESAGKSSAQGKKLKGGKEETRKTASKKKLSSNRKGNSSKTKSSSRPTKKRASPRKSSS